MLRRRRREAGHLRGAGVRVVAAVGISGPPLGVHGESYEEHHLADWCSRRGPGRRARHGSGSPLPRNAPITRPSASSRTPPDPVGWSRARCGRRSSAHATSKPCPALSSAITGLTWKWIFPRHTPTAVPIAETPPSRPAHGPSFWTTLAALKSRLTRSRAGRPTRRGCLTHQGVGARCGPTTSVRLVERNVNENSRSTSELEAQRNVRVGSPKERQSWKPKGTLELEAQRNASDVLGAVHDGFQRGATDPV